MACFSNLKIYLAVVLNLFAVLKQILHDSLYKTFEPCSKRYEVSPDFKMPERKAQTAPYHLPEIIRTPSGSVRDYGFRLPSDAFMRFVKENGTSPSVMLSMLVGEAIKLVHPDADAPVMVNVPISIRRMLGCEETFKNCSSRAVLPINFTPLDALPFAQRAAQLRGMLKQPGLSSQR